MSDELYVDGLGIAPGVMETIVTLAAKDVEGVASVGASTLDGISSLLSSKQPPQAIEVEMGDDKKVQVNVHIDVYYGQVIPEVAERVRAAVADAVATQVGLEVGSVDVFVDGVNFGE